MDNLKNKRRAFTLIELIIVVSILGILAAIVLPEVQGHTQQAKEAAAKDNLRILRNAIEQYALENNGVAPGYANNDPSRLPTGVTFSIQLTIKHLNDIPENPFNNLNTVDTISNGTDFPETADGLSGWIYKPYTKEIRLNTGGTDSKDENYFDY